MKKLMATFFAFISINTVAGESKVICSTVGNLNENNVYTVSSTTALATESLNKNIQAHAKLGFTSISAPTHSVSSVKTATIEETTVVMCVTVVKP